MSPPCFCLNSVDASAVSRAHCGLASLATHRLLALRDDSIRVGRPPGDAVVDCSGQHGTHHHPSVSPICNHHPLTVLERLLGTHSFHLPVELGPGVFRMTKWVEGGEIITKFEGDLDRSKIIGESHVLSPPAQAFAAPQTLPLPPTPQGYISSSPEYPSPQTFNPAMDQQRPHSFPTTEAPHPPQGSNPGQGYNPAQGYNPGQGYNTAPQGYSPSQGYGPPQSHSPARVHSPAQGYNPSQGYPSAQGYSSPRPYTPSQPYNAPQQPHGYAPPQTYSPSQGYNRYNAPLPYLPGRQFSPGPNGSAPPSPLVRDMRPAVAHWLQHI